MTKGAWYMAMYVKNLMLMCVMAIVLLFLFDVAKEELYILIDRFSLLSDNIRVIVVTGIAAIPAALTHLEARLIQSIYVRGNRGTTTS